MVLHPYPTKDPILLTAPGFAEQEFHFLLSLNKGGGALPYTGGFPRRPQSGTQESGDPGALRRS